MLRTKMKYHLILVLISVTLLFTLNFLTFVSALNSTIFVSVDVSGLDPNNVTTSIYDGQTRSEKIKLINPGTPNNTYFFQFDVKNVPESTEEERNYADEDEDAEFRVCAFVDKKKNNYKEVVCENILVTDTRENISLDFR